MNYCIETNHILGKGVRATEKTLGIGVNEKKGYVQWNKARKWAGTVMSLLKAKE